MISTFLNQKTRSFNILFMVMLYSIVSFSFGVADVFAQQRSAVGMTVSPSIFEMTANPEQEWVSQVRVINPNQTELEVYVNVVNFVPQGETGQPRFVPVIPEETKGATIAEWISVEQPSYVIPPEKSINIPFRVFVPSDAQPGGHFAAMLIGTRPPEGSSENTRVETSQVITSLFFLRVSGEVRESGEIRTFRATDSLVNSPEVNLELRFENKGNVHIQPQGEIVIKNMWGKERGSIPVNQQTLFGNVLPETIRKFNFAWKGESVFSDFGRYTAEVTLAYGNDSRQFTTSETTFWIIPWKILLTISIILIGFGLFATWAIKAYVRKMLSMAGVSPELQFMKRRSMPRQVSVAAPLEEGMLDLRRRMRSSESAPERLKSVLAFIMEYRIFFVSLLVILFFGWLLFFYIQSAVTDSRVYEVTVEEAGMDVTISSEEIEYEKLKQEEVVTGEEISVGFPDIKIINRSGIHGLGAKLRLKLETAGFTVTDLSTDLSETQKSSVIVYSPERAQQALELSQVVDDVLLSAFDGEDTESSPITIYVGSNLESAIE